jgi:hypothetical protein
MLMKRRKKDRNDQNDIKDTKWDGKYEDTLYGPNRPDRKEMQGIPQSCVGAIPLSTGQWAQSGFFGLHQARPISHARTDDAGIFRE